MKTERTMVTPRSRGFLLAALLVVIADGTGASSCDVQCGDLAVTFCRSGTSSFADLKRDAIDIQAADRLHILIASLEDVIRSKAAAGREKDRLALPRLRRLLNRLQGDE